jgi:hypothetical protein
LLLVAVMVQMVAVAQVALELPQVFQFLEELL